MKHILATLMVLAMPAAMQATEANDTTISYHGRQIVIGDTLGRLTVSALDATGTQLVKTQETTFVDGQEIEQIYVSSPFIPSSHKKPRRFRSHFPMLYLGHDMLCGSPLSFKRPNSLATHNNKSYEIGLSGCDFAIPFNRQHTLGLTGALQVGWVRHYLDEGYTLVNDDGMVQQQPIPGSRAKRSYISYTYTRVPLLLELQQKANRHELFGGVGLSVELRDSGKARYRGSSSGSRTTAENLNLNSVGLNLEMHAGIDNVDIFLRSALTPLMENGHGPKCYPLSIGFGIRL